MNDQEKPKINPEFTIEKFEDEILLYSEARTKALYLNDTAYSVWLLCKEDMNVGQMVQYLEDVYPSAKEQIRSDVMSALDTLKSNGIIEFADE